MSVIDLLRSPLAIAGIVGSVAIGGGLTVYVVRDGAVPGQTAPTTEAFPGVFVVKTETPVQAMPFDFNDDGSLKHARIMLSSSDQNSTKILVTEFNQCELDANVSVGCTFKLRGDTQITFRRHDRDQSRVVLSGKHYGNLISPSSYNLN